MAAQLITEGEFIEGGDVNDPDLNQAFYDFIDTIKAEANSGGSISVFEVPVDANGTPRPNTLNKTKLFSVPVGSMTYEDICDRVLREFVEPGGKIMIQLLGRQDGKRGNRLNQLIPLRRGKVETNRSDGTTAGDVERLMRVMDERVARQSAEIRAMLEQNRTPLIDPLSQSLAITKQLTEMAVAMSGRGGQSGAPGAPGVTGLTTDPTNMMNQMMAMMMTKMMKKFFEDDGGEKRQDASAGILDNIRALAAPLLQAKAAGEERALIAERRMLAHEGARAVAPAPNEPAVPAEPKKAASEPATQDPKETAKMKLMAMLKEALPLITELAQAKADPVDSARLALKEVPEDDHDLSDALYALTQEDDCLKQMAVLEPRVLEHAEWFEKFRLALRDEFDPDRAEVRTS